MAPPPSPPQRWKPLEFVGSAKDDLSRFPEEVKDLMGFALHLAQRGDKHRAAKPLTGHKDFKGAGILEIIEDFDGDTYRAEGVVYVLHAFQKKSKKGVQTPKHEIELIKQRMTRAREHYEEKYSKKRKAG